MANELLSDDKRAALTLSPCVIFVTNHPKVGPTLPKRQSFRFCPPSPSGRVGIGHRVGFDRLSILECEKSWRTVLTILYRRMPFSWLPSLFPHFPLFSHYLCLPLHSQYPIMPKKKESSKTNLSNSTCLEEISYDY